MARFSFASVAFTFFLAYLVGIASAAPIAVTPSLIIRAPCTNEAATSTTSIFKLQDYADFQISDGTAGDSAAAANAVFVDPFKGVDLATVSSQDLENVKTMAKAAVDAEDQFNTAIDAASGDEKTALENGKIANKVLKLTGEVQALAIQVAQGDSGAQSDLTTEQTKLTKDTKLDAAAAGQSMSSFLSV